MSLKAKIALAFAGTFVLFSISACVVYRHVVFPSFLALEHDDALLTIQRCRALLHRELAELGRIASDYAVWDETCRFIETGDTNYVVRNLVPTTFKDNDLSALLIYDLAGQPRYRQAYDADADAFVDLPPFTDYGFWLALRSAGANAPALALSGVLSSARGPALIAALPILTSHGDGPPRGTLTVARLLTPERMTLIGPPSDVAVSLIPVRDRALSAREQQILTELSTSSAVSVVAEPERIIGRMLLRDLWGRPLALVEASRPRGLVAAGRRALREATLLLFASSLTILLVVLLFLRTTILNRTGVLEGFVRRVAGTRNLSSRIRVGGNDEITRLADGINGMLGNLERAEDDRRQAEKRYRLLFTEMLEGFALHEIILDSSGTPCDYRFIELNPAFERLTGIKASDAVGRTVRAIMPAIEPQWIETYGKVALTGEPVHFENYSTPLGRHFEVTAFSPAQRQFATVFRDVTDRRKAEEERERFEQRMRHAQKLESLGVLAGGIAHDFNNLLTGVLGNVELALDDLPPGSPIEGHLRDIEKSGRRAANLCRQMLAYAGKGQFAVESTDLNGLIEDLVSFLRVSVSKKAALHYALEPSLPHVNADRIQIQQVVMNLVINASEAIGEQRGNIRIATGSLHCSPEQLASPYLQDPLPGGLYVFLEVADTGCGMNADTVARMFDPFFSTKFTGRGLGLASALGIVRGHRGSIQVTTEEGKGTTFRVLLPAGAEPTRPANDALVPPAGSPAEE